MNWKLKKSFKTSPMIENRMVFQLLSYADGKEEIGVKVAIANGKASDTASLYRNNAPMERIKGEADGSWIVFNICGFSRLPILHLILILPISRLFSFIIQQNLHQLNL
jgi:hypothetical protein